jgi:hypothetical protein
MLANLGHKEKTSLTPSFEAGFLFIYKTKIQIGFKSWGLPSALVSPGPENKGQTVVYSRRSVPGQEAEDFPERKIVFY